MLCPKCKSEILDSSKFCPECGSNISAISANSAVEKDLSIGAYRTVSAPVPEIDKSVGGIRTVSSKESVFTGADSSVRIIKDRYELQEEIGRGGFSVVYKGLDKKLNRAIAVKVLSVQARLDTLKPCHVIPVIRRDRSDMVKTPTRLILPSPRFFFSLNYYTSTCPEFIEGYS